MTKRINGILIDFDRLKDVYFNNRGNVILDYGVDKAEIWMINSGDGERLISEVCQHMEGSFNAS